MREFKGFDDWIEIFRGGKQVDSQGREHDGDAIIEKAIATFNTDDHEPPLVVGHPKDNSPAFGWVAGLKKVGNVLYAKFRDVVSEFDELVKKGLYKKRSASFYPDGRLRHIGFLGAMPPAIKGLADLKFKKGGNSMDFEFNEGGDPGEVLHQKVLELLKSPPASDHLGRPIGENFTYRDAFDFVMRENPELAQGYVQSL